jgi:hypothetical protein
MEIELFFFFFSFYLVLDLPSESASVIRWFCDVPDTSNLKYLRAGEASRAWLRSPEYLLLLSLERGLVKFRVFLGMGEIDISLTDLV